MKQFLRHPHPSTLLAAGRMATTLGCRNASRAYEVLDGVARPESFGASSLSRDKNSLRIGEALDRLPCAASLVRRCLDAPQRSGLNKARSASREALALPDASSTGAPPELVPTGRLRDWLAALPGGAPAAWSKSPAHRFPSPHFSAQSASGFKAFESRLPSSVSR